VAALAATRWLSSLLFETSSYDPMTFLVAPIVLAGVALLACLIPAYRASRVDRREARCSAIYEMPSRLHSLPWPWRHLGRSLTECDATS
jgi:hypothetical protein